MRKRAKLPVLGASILLAGGCVGVVKTTGPYDGPSYYRQAVATDGGIYVVDVRTGEVTKIDSKSIQEAKPFVPSDDEHTKVIIVDD